MKRFYYFFLLFLVFFASSCEKVKEPLTGSIYGTVNDKATGDPIFNVNVKLVESSESITTGSDGVFEFHNLEEGIYCLQFTKIGYKSDTKNNIAVKGGINYKPVFVQMEKLPPSFRIIDDSGKDITEINFGYEPEDNMRTFTILNDGEDKFEWSIPAEGRAKWIKTISPSDGELRSGKSQPVLVVIDRDVLKEGNNEATIVVQTTNNVGKEIKVTALAYQAPVINLYEPTDVSYENVTLEAVVTNTGFPEYRLFGFFVSQDLQHDLKNADKNDKNISIPKKDADDMMTSKGKISQVVANLTPNVTYYARVYTIRDIDTTYSNVISFVTKIPNLPKLTIKLSNEGVNGLTAKFECEISDDGGSEIKEKGVCWSSDPTLKPRDYTNKRSYGKGSTPATFTATIEEFEANKTYYVYSYAENSDGTGYSDNPAIVKTSNGKPAVETMEVSQTSSESVDVRYKISNDAGVGIIEHGVCYGTTQYPDISTSVRSEESGDIGIHTAHISGLKANTTYYFRAYAKNTAGIGYAENQKDFMINIGLPEVETIGCLDYTSNSAVCKGRVTDDGGSKVTERGICWSLNANPTISDSHKADIYDGTGDFTCTLTNLSVATTYHYRAYAKNSAGYNYGNDETFTTKGDAPIVTTLAATNVAGSSAVLHGRITNDGGDAITNCGFVCSNGQTIEHLQNVNGEFSTTITGLSPNVNYTYYAFAENNYGEGKGVSQTIKITAKAPGVSNRGASDITSTSATITGNITNDGGSEVEVCGVCYSANVTRPTPQNSICTEIRNVSTGMFSSTITGLSPKTKYYYNVYAKNAVDISYGIPANFTTESGSGSSCSQSVKISQPPTYNGNEATVYGRITSDCEITRWGIVVGLSNSAPSLDNYDAILNNNGSPYSNDISLTVTDIPSLTMIYYRFFVVNSQNKVAYSESNYLVVY